MSISDILFDEAANLTMKLTNANVKRGKPFKQQIEI